MSRTSFDQHLLENESFADYKKRVLDTKSNSFCGAKWYYATIWLNSGQTTSCHHPLPHQIDPIEVQKNYKLLSNTSQKKKERKEMQQGIQCKGCDYCWRVENLKTGKISDRVYKSVLYSDQDLEEAFNSDVQKDFDLKYLEISFDRTCNFACSYCNPAFSTTWAKDITSKGAYTDIGEDGNNHYGHDHKQANRFNDDDNPYIEAFFKWWKSDLHKTLTHLRLTGGEPLMSKHTWKLLDLMAEEKSNVKYFAINTNINAKDELIEKLIMKAKKIKCLNLYTSNESIGDKAEYIRDGLDWSSWNTNFNKIKKSEVFSSTHVMCTINAIALEGLIDFLEWCLSIKKKYKSKDGITFTLNILRFPNFQSCLILPYNLRNYFATNLKEWLKKHKNSEYLHEMEIEHIARLIDYLINKENKIDQINNLQKFFKNFYKQYDERRNKNFEKIFPIIGEWYHGL